MPILTGMPVLFPPSVSIRFGIFLVKEQFMMKETHGSRLKSQAFSPYSGIFLYSVFLAFALVFAGCKKLDNDESKGGIDRSLDNPAKDLKLKFAVSKTEKAGVAATFRAISAYLYLNADELNTPQSKIRLGDYIDLEGGLTVEAYSGDYGDGHGIQGYQDYGGGFSYDAAAAMSPVKDQGRRLRLIVVGINSFKNGGTDGSSAYKYPGADTPPQHAVFQFQHIPVICPLLRDYNYNHIGYAESETRKYLTLPGAEAGTGRNFLKGLYEAGVPQNVLWSPTRSINVFGGTNSSYAHLPDQTVLLTDALWLPTQWELFGAESQYSAFYRETEATQARLEYYRDNASRIKIWMGSGNPEMNGWPYWTATCDYHSLGVHAYNINYKGNVQVSDAECSPAGIVPAFCVKATIPAE
jgi:hypothetical protein